MDGVLADIARAWAVAPENEPALAEDAYEMLDRATAARRAHGSGGPVWAAARLAEGLARFLVARQMAEWNNRSYALQAAEASIDALRDAAASLPDAFTPSRAAVSAFRERLLHEWHAAQSEPDLNRIANLTVAGLRDEGHR
jgi:hypothetical protein